MMCGVHGIVSPALGLAEMERRLRRMGSVQRHRGPDDAGLRVWEGEGNSVGLGFDRLSIIDPEGGMQPIVSPADGCAIVCNGEVYNYPELRRDHLAGQPMLTRSDAEVALHLYRRYGDRFLDLCNGMFAGAVLDPRRSRLLLFRDRFGIKPLYYAVTEEGVFFASETAALAEGSGLRPELDPAALPLYLTFRFVPGDATALKGVRRLPPGCLMEVDLRTGGSTVRRWWEYRPGAGGERLGGREARELFAELLRDAVGVRLRSDVEVGAFVSGGVDSSSVASLAAGVQPDIRLFTISFEDERYDELPMVRAMMDAMPDRFGSSRLEHSVCRRDSLEELPEVVQALGEPVSLGTVLPTDQVCRMASERVKVVLTGEGADEVFAGYRKFLLERAAAELGEGGVSGDRLKGLLPDLPDYMDRRRGGPARACAAAEALFTSDELARLLGRPCDPVTVPGEAIPDLRGISSPLDRMLAVECRTRLPDYVVARLDRLSMRHSLEARTPYLDHRLAELAGSLHPEDKVDLARMMGKAVCRDSLVESGVVDGKTATRHKRPFTIPMAAWLLRGGAPELVREVFEGGMLAGQGLLDPEAALGVWRRVTTEGVAPDTLVSAADRAFALLCLTLWVDRTLA
jgi:asparagine synthase (glutamine-hydrolysing)